VAEVAQKQGISIKQVNECLNSAKTAATEAKTAAAQQYGVIEKSIPNKKVLANTGGFPLLAGAGLLLLASIAVGSMVIGRR
jgi:hypothetical protein